MNTKPSWPAALALAISACLLGACGGGSHVRTESAITPAGDPPPPLQTGECPSPITADCVVDLTSGSQQMTGGRDSDHALVKRGDGELDLLSHPNHYDGPPTIDFRFGGGTTIEAGILSVGASASLHSDVVVEGPGYFFVSGDMTGSATNHGDMLLWGTVTGNVANDGILTPGDSTRGDVIPARIVGNFSQTAAGTLDYIVGATSGGYLSVTGRADIDGTLRLVRGFDWDSGYYPLPATPVSLKVLHADGGVFGQFANWILSDLFVTGDLRYAGNDVFFDASAISAAQAMAAARAGDAITLQSAAHFDAALGNASGAANAPGSLTDTRRRFVASASAIQRLRTWDQAVRTFDSLSGSGYTAAIDSLMQQASMPAADLMSRMDSVHAGSKLGAWSGSAAMLASGTGTFSENRAGYDGWLGDGVLLGASLGWSDGSLRFDRFGGTARDRSPQWDVYLRRDLAAGAYVFGDIGYDHHQVNFNRRIDLGVVQQAASAMRALGVTRGYLEAGRDFRIGQARLTPFGAISHVILQGGGFAEQGGTGFELIAQPATYRQTGAAIGLRLGRDWRHGDRWTALNVSTGYQQILGAEEDTRVAFAGVPDMTFVLDGMPRQQNIGWLHANLATGNERWNWLLSYDRQASDEALSLGARLSF